MKHFRTEINPVTGAREDYYWDDQEQKLTVRNRHEIGDILEENKQTANKTIDQRYGNQMLHRVASIPMAVVMKLKKEHNIDVFTKDPTEKRRLLRILDDPEYRYLKTTTRKLVVR